MKLIRLRTIVAEGKHDWGFTQLGKAQVHALSLDLSSDPMRTLKSKIKYVGPTTLRSSRLSEFRRTCQAPRWIHATRDGDASHEPDRERARVPVAFGRMGQACEKAMEEAVDEYMYATIVLIQCEYATAPMEQRLRIIPIHE